MSISCSYFFIQWPGVISLRSLNLMRTHFLLVHHDMPAKSGLAWTAQVHGQKFTKLLPDEWFSLTRQGT